MQTVVTGAAGFIGSNLTDRLLRDGHRVVGYDNFSTGQRRFLQEACGSDRFTLIQGDTLDLPGLTTAMRGCDLVVHFAANADVRFGTDHPRKDLDQNTIATFNVLEAMRANGVRRIAFSSTGSIYGEPEVFPTPENAPFPAQTSLYGALKLAGEGLIQAYCEGFGFQAYIFRFVSILGERYSHGHVFDFYRSLRAQPREMVVLGNGHHKKSYLYVQDCIDAMLLAIDKAQGKVNVFNLARRCAHTGEIGSPKRDEFHLTKSASIFRHAMQSSYRCGEIFQMRRAGHPRSMTTWRRGGQSWPREWVKSSRCFNMA